MCGATREKTVVKSRAATEVGRVETLMIGQKD